MTLEELQNGKFFLIDKPLDWTSFDAVNKIKYNIRRSYEIKKIKIGHAGTLDPRATGLLIVCVGKFTKRITEFQGLAKTYTGKFKLGATTESYDTEKPENEFFKTEHITEELIQKTTQLFLGKIEQYPPIHSAIKQDGKKLYELARAGKKVKPKVRNVEIYDFKILSFDMPEIEFEVSCSKGTYIRSLAHDFGKALDSGAYLTELRRTKIGDHKVENANNDFLNQEYWNQLANSTHESD